MSPAADGTDGVDVDPALRDGLGFEWGETDGTTWLRNADAEYKRVEPAFFDVLVEFARGERALDSAPTDVRTAVAILHEEGYLVPDGEIRQCETPADVSLRPRLGGFAALLGLFALLMGLQWERLPELPRAMTSTADFLLVAGVLTLSIPVHELGHYLVSRRYFEPSIGFTRLNKVFPAVVTKTSDAWRCPRNVRIWISLAGPTVDVAIATVLAAVFLLVPERRLVGLLAGMLVVRVLFVLNPLIDGDGYWILVDLFGLHNLRSRGFRDLKALRISGPAAYAAAVVVFTAALFAVMAWIVGTSLLGRIPLASP